MNPNVLLVILDSVRAKNTSLYGHYNETTPFLEEFAERATVYEQARSPNIHSIASHASIFTGYHTLEHRLTEHESEIEAGHTIWEQLSERRGYDTGLFTPNPVLTQSSNLHECFDDTVGTDLRYPMSAESLAEESGSTYVDDFTQWARGRTAPWAGCINLIDAHYPYRASADNDRWGTERLRDLQRGIDQIGTDFYTGERPFWQLEALENLYDGAIRELDEQVRRLVEFLEETGQYENTLLVITSDHGEAFGEPSRVSPDARLVSHSAGVHEVLTHVPLLVKRPFQTEGETVEEVVSLAQFPRAVERTLAGRDRDAFTSPETVTTYTERFKHPDDALGESAARRTNVEGPWLAYYRDTDPVTKHLLHDGATATVAVENAQNAYRVGDADEGPFDELFGRYHDRGVAKRAENELAPDTERRLEYLGYVDR